MRKLPAEIIALKHEFDLNPTRENVFALLDAIAERIMRQNDLAAEDRGVLLDVAREALEGAPGLLP